jgi:hypothetical protein
MTKKYCGKGSRKCKICNKCIQKSYSKEKTHRCANGMRKCADRKCHSRDEDKISRKTKSRTKKNKILPVSYPRSFKNRKSKKARTVNSRFRSNKFVEEEEEERQEEEDDEQREDETKKEYEIRLKKKKCPKGQRKCRYTGKCVIRSMSKREKKCPKGTRRCADNQCY